MIEPIYADLERGEKLNTYFALATTSRAASGI
jgi:hypothetical protein